MADGPYSLEVATDLVALGLALALGFSLAGRLRGTRLWFPLSVFFGSVAIFAGADAAAHLSGHMGDHELEPQLVRASNIGIGLAIPALVHLAMSYPRNLTRSEVGNAVAVVYGAGIVFAVLTPTNLLFLSVDVETGGPGTVYGPMYWPLQTILTGALATSVAWLLFLASRGSPVERRPAAALGTSISLPLAIGGTAAAAGLTTFGPVDVFTAAFGLAMVLLSVVVYTGRFAPSAQTTFHALVESIDEAVVIVDSKGRPTSTNPRARAVLGLQGDARGASGVGTLLEAAGLAEDKTDALQRTVLAVLRGRLDSYSGVLERVGPSKRTCTVRVLPLGRRDAQDQAEAALVMLRDETDRIGLEAANVRSRDILDLVIRMLGHDLKAPLTVVQGYIELGQTRLSGTDLKAEVPAVRRDLERMSEAIVGMHLLMGNARALSRLAAVGEEAPPPVHVDLSRTVRQTVDLLRPLADTKRVRVEAALADGVMVRAAPGFESVPRNLLDNAIKYTPPGGTVTVTVTSGGGQAVLTVADTGPGIPLESVDRLFRKFERLGAEKGAQEGHGLGLSIVAKLVELAEGRIAVDDRTDGRQGAVFRVELKCTSAPA